MAGRPAARAHRRPVQPDRGAAGPAAGGRRHHHLLARARQLVQPADHVDRAELAQRGARLSRRARPGDPHRHRQHGQGPRRCGADRRRRRAQVPRADVRAGRPARPARRLRGRCQGRGEGGGARGRADPLHRAARAPDPRRRGRAGAAADAARHLPRGGASPSCATIRTPISTSPAASTRRSSGTCGRHGSRRAAPTRACAQRARRPQVRARHDVLHDLADRAAGGDLGRAVVRRPVRGADPAPDQRRPAGRQAATSRSSCRSGAARATCAACR